MIDELKIECNISDNLLCYDYDTETKIATLKDANMDYKNMKLFFKLLMRAQQELESHDCEKVRVWVTETDWDSFLCNESKWKKIDTESQIQNMLRTSVPKNMREEMLILTEIDIKQYALETAKGCGFNLN